jgi:hypothetical protein
MIGRPIGPGRQPAVTNSICLVLIRHMSDDKIILKEAKYYVCRSGSENVVARTELIWDAGSRQQPEIPVDCALPKSLLTLLGAVELNFWEGNCDVARSSARSHPVGSEGVS